jgi:hypothetical protein
MSKPKNPVELVDRYLQAVRFWLPKTQQQEELIAELGDDLRSQIEAQEEELGRPLDNVEASAILKRCGAPMVVASRLGPKQYLIGPALFPIYWFVLKMVLFWILVPVFIFIVGPANWAGNGKDWGMAALQTFGDLWSGLFIAAGIVTLVFAILERTSAHAAIACKFDPLTLPPVQKIDPKPSALKTVCQLIFGVFGLVWLLLIPTYPVLILGPAAAFLHAAPMWHKFYIPILLLSALSLARSGVTLAKPQWEWFPPVAELAQAIFTLILLNFILNGWFPYVVLTEAAKNSVQYIKVAAIVNVSILISLAGAWLGLSIAIVIQLWQLMNNLRKWRRAGQAASLQAQ